MVFCCLVFTCIFLCTIMLHFCTTGVYIRPRSSSIAGWWGFQKLWGLLGFPGVQSWAFISLGLQKFFHPTADFNGQLDRIAQYSHCCNSAIYPCCTVLCGMQQTVKDLKRTIVCATAIPGGHVHWAIAHTLVSDEVQTRMFRQCW